MFTHRSTTCSVRASSRMRWLSGLLAFLAVILSSGHGAQAESRSAYSLVGDDKVKVTIVDWRSGEGEYREWEALGGVYRIDAVGRIAIPLVGEVDAAGVTTSELADRIAGKLAGRSSTGKPPSVSVEISEYGPIYVTGEVEKPGQYPFAPELTVMKAVSLAGGLRRPSDSAESRVEREQIQSARTLKEGQIDRSDLLVRQARLRAELAGEDDFAVPEAIVGAPNVEQIVADERSFQSLRWTEFQGKLEAARSLKALFAEEIDSLVAKIASQEEQVALVGRELKSISDLVQRGLTVSSREFGLQRIVAESQSQLLDLRVALTRARQAQEQAERSLTELANERNSQIQSELGTIATQLRKAELAIRIAGLMMDETAYFSARLDAGDDEDSSRIAYRITRKNAAGGQTVIAADPQTIIAPRDLVEVIAMPHGASTSAVDAETGNSPQAADRLARPNSSAAGPS
jgi:polysaccharide biosynthesis/export protein ExoF